MKRPFNIRRYAIAGSVLLLLLQHSYTTSAANPSLNALRGSDGCFTVLNSRSERVFYGDSLYAWNAEIHNVCSDAREIEVEIEWFDVNGFSLGSDQDSRFVVGAGDVGIARSIKSLGENIFITDQIASHQITVNGVTPLPESVAACLVISSANSDSLIVDSISQHSWSVTIQNRCSVDLFTSVEYRGITDNGYPIFGPALSTADGPSPSLADFFVPANENRVARHQFRYRQNSNGPLRADEFRLSENSIPEFSNVRTAVNSTEASDGAFFYDTKTGIVTLPIFESTLGYFEVTFKIIDFSKKVNFVVIPSSIKQLPTPPAVVATLTLPNKKLFIPNLQANDGSVRLKNLTLKYQNKNPLLFRLQSAAYSAPTLERGGYSLDGNQCIEIVSVNSEQGRAGGPESGPPGLDWNVTIANGCSAEQEISLTYAALNSDGLIAVSQSESIRVPALENIEVGRFLIFPRFLDIEPGANLDDFVTVKY